MFWPPRYITFGEVQYVFQLGMRMQQFAEQQLQQQSVRNKQRIRQCRLGYERKQLGYGKRLRHGRKRRFRHGYERPRRMRLQHGFGGICARSARPAGTSRANGAHGRARPSGSARNSRRNRSYRSSGSRRSARRNRGDRSNRSAGACRSSGSSGCDRGNGSRG